MPSATWRTVRAAIISILQEHLNAALESLDAAPLSTELICADDQVAGYDDSVLVTYQNQAHGDRHDGWANSELHYAVHVLRAGGDAETAMSLAADTEAAVCRVLNGHLDLDNAVQAVGIGTSIPLRPTEPGGVFCQRFDIPVACRVSLAIDESGLHPDV